MFKTMIVMTRKPEIDQGDFVRWWTGQHGRLAIALPGIKRIVLNETLDSEIGGIAELWFDSPEDFSAALGSAAGQAALADAQSMTSDLKLLPVVEHDLPLNGV